ncbi:MAG: class I adenylate-forming enzyme family protein [Candidatus Polarisedimenticolia bacterium]
MNPPGRIVETATRALGGSPAREVLSWAGGGRTAEQVLAEAEALAARLRHHGLAAGEVVMLAGLPPDDFVIGCLAAWGCDAVVLAPDAQTTSAELDALRAAFAPRLVVGPDDIEGSMTASGHSPYVPPRGTALIKLTSGSEGRPRGVAVTADQLLADGRHLIDGMALTPDDLHVAAIPLSHSYGMGSLVMPLVLLGTPLAFVDPRHPGALAEVLSREERMVFPGVPSLFALLCRDDAPAIEARGLRLCISAGAPLPSGVARAFREKTGLPVRSFYGTSETGGISFDDSPAGDAAEVLEGCVGRPLPGLDVTLDDGGRVVVRSDAVGLGYTHHVDGAAGRFAEGAFHTADTAAWASRPGRPPELSLVGRIGAVVNVAGRKVDPAEVERALRRLPGVRDAVVIGMPDLSRGEALAACVEAEASLARDAVMAGLRRELAAWKLPRRLVVVDQMPRNERGKTDVDALRRRLLEDVGNY